MPESKNWPTADASMLQATKRRQACGHACHDEQAAFPASHTSACLLHHPPVNCQLWLVHMQGTARRWYRSRGVVGSGSSSATAACCNVRFELPQEADRDLSLTFSAGRYCVPLALGSRQKSSTTLCTIRSTRNGIACRLTWLALIPAMAGSLLIWLVRRCQACRSRQAS